MLTRFALIQNNLANRKKLSGGGQGDGKDRKGNAVLPFYRKRGSVDRRPSAPIRSLLSSTKAACTFRPSPNPEPVRCEVEMELPQI